MSSRYHSGPAPRVSRARTRDHSADLYLKPRCVSTMPFNSIFVNDFAATEAAQLISVAPGHLYRAQEPERCLWMCPPPPSGPGTVTRSLNFPDFRLYLLISAVFKIVQRSHYYPCSGHQTSASTTWRDTGADPSIPGDLSGNHEEHLRNTFLETLWIIMRITPTIKMIGRYIFMYLFESKIL